MSDLVPYHPVSRRTHDQQIRDALEQALVIQGTVINDLEAAINCILAMERGMQMCGVPNPNDADAQYLKKKYKMERKKADEQSVRMRRLLERGDGGLAEGNSDQLELVDGEVVDD